MLARLTVSIVLIAAIASLLAGCGSGGGAGANSASGTFTLGPTSRDATALDASTIPHVLQLHQSGNVITGTLDGSGGEQVNGTISGRYLALDLTKNGQKVGFLNGTVNDNQIEGTLNCRGSSMEVSGTAPAPPNPDIAGDYAAFDVTGGRGPYPLTLLLNGNTVTGTLKITDEDGDTVLVVVQVAGVASGDSLIVSSTKSNDDQPPDAAFGKLSSSSEINGTYVFSDSTGQHVGIWRAEKAQK